MRAYTVSETSNDTEQERTVDALYLGSSDNGSGHDVVKLSTKQRTSASRVTLIPMTQDLIDRINTMGIGEGELEGVEFSDLFGNTANHDIELRPNEHGMFDDDDDNNISDVNFVIDEKAMNKEIVAEEELDLAKEADDDTSHDALEDSDSHMENPEVDDSDSNIENPEV